MKQKLSILFFVGEGLLLLLAGIFTFGGIRITVIPMICIALTVILAICHLIYYLSFKKSKRAKILRTVLASILLISVAGFAALEIFIISSARTDENPEAEYVIVLGAGVNGTQPSYILYDRLMAAKDYLDNYPEAKAVVSGGQGPGEDITEAECMRRWLEANGIAPERILMEEKSTSTYENLQYSFEVIRADGGDTSGDIAIISNEFHLFRAKQMAEELGAQPIGVAAKTSAAFLKISYFVREAFAVAAMWIM